MTAVLTDAPRIEAALRSTASPIDPPSYRCTLVRGGAAVLQALSELADAPTHTDTTERYCIVPGAFQSLPWLKALFDVVAPARSAEPLLVLLHDEVSGDIALALPMLVQREGSLSVAGIADLGLSDYCAPWLGPAAPADPAAAARLRATLHAALAGVDLVHFEKMPGAIGGHVNPLALHERAVPSRFSGNTLTVPDTVAAFVASRGKKYRKEAERARRRLEEMGEVRFVRATTPAEIDATYRQLESWQAERHREAGHSYVLDEPEISRFYRTLLHDTAADGAASLYALTVGGERAAVLLGVKTATTFTLIRIADGGERWRQTSPGRMIVLEAMQELVGEGIREFDMGIGDYPFKRWIGCQATPLVDVVVPLTWRARPHVAARDVRRRLRSNPQLRAIVRKIRTLRRPAAAPQQDE